MQVISKFIKGIRFLFCVIYIFSKYTWIILLKDKNVIAISNGFQKVSNKSNRKSNKMWVNIGKTFCNRSVKSSLEKNAIEMYSTHNSRKICCH